MLPITFDKIAEEGFCPVRNLLAQVTGKWKILILLALEDEALRFGAIKRVIDDITQRVLTENLRGLERDGYLTRTVFAGPPVAVSYELTAMGQDLVTHIKPLIFWANEIIPEVKENRNRYDDANK
ncbi:MAG: helix-turn-helix domain-containing protein [Verrucomicrobiota bacterium]